MTDAEQRLWSGIRQRQLLGVRFRRQVPLGPYVVDFLCVEERLVLEVDGGQRNESLHDARRDEFLRDQGYRVLRFWNHDVLMNIEAVLLAVLESLEKRPHPNLPSQAGEGAKAQFT